MFTTPSAGITAGHITPSRTTLKPHACSRAASSRPSERTVSKAPLDGRYAPTFSTAFTPWKMRARPLSSTMRFDERSTWYAARAVAPRLAQSATTNVVH